MRDSLLSRRKLILTGLLTGIIIFFIIYFILAPRVKSYVLAREELAAASENLVKARAAAALLDSESDRLKKAKEDYDIKSGPFKMLTRDGSDIIFLVMKAASGNVAAAEIIPGDIIEKRHTLELPVKVVLQGDFRSLAGYCREIESGHSANLLEIRSLKIETLARAPGAKVPAAAPDPGMVKATLGIVIFSVKNPAGKQYLEEISKSLVGRGDVFRPVASAPAPAGLR